MSNSDRNYDGFLNAKPATSFPTTSTKVTPAVTKSEPPVEATESELSVVATEDAVLDLTTDHAVVTEPAPQTPKPAAKAKKKASSRSDSTGSSLVRTTFSMPAELVDRVGERADSDHVWKTDVVMDAIDSQLHGVDAATSRRRRRRGHQNAAISMSLEPSLIAQLQDAAGEHGSASWVVAQCLEKYLGQ